MLIKTRYSTIDLLLWTRWETLKFLLYTGLVTALYQLAGWTFLNVPWTPVALVGTGVAFMIGFQNNSAYGRIWEARKIWGGIVNTSRSWGMNIQEMVSTDHSDQDLSVANERRTVKGFIDRHIAWLTALRHAMRQPRKWEVVQTEHTNREWANSVHIPERVTAEEDELRILLGEEDFKKVARVKNRSAAILYLQAENLRAVKEEGLVWEFSFLKLMGLLDEMFNLQGQSERIKNFPYPRQYATLSYGFVWVFIALLPFGIVPEFHHIAGGLKTDFPLISEYFIWLAIPFCTVVSWVFHTMERIGRVGENPFEGTPNDVPISTIARGIEIDLRQLFNEVADSIPPQFPEKRDVQM